VDSFNRCGIVIYSNFSSSVVIILEAETILIRDHQVVFEGCFQNTNEGQMVSYSSDEVDHYFLLQGLLNHLGDERRASYITAIFRKILDFLYV
jgi:hypothetical protein